jgi:hypothetical protein
MSGVLARGLRARRGGLEGASPASVLASPDVIDGVSVAVSALAVIAILHSYRYMVDRAFNAPSPILSNPTAARLAQ